MTPRGTIAAVKAKRIRKAIARLYERYPEWAVAHVNEWLDQASRAEQYRAAFLSSVE